MRAHRAGQDNEYLDRHGVERPLWVRREYALRRLPDPPLYGGEERAEYG